MVKNIIKPLILMILIFTSCRGSSSESDQGIKAKQEITHLLQKWPQDFNARNIDAVCGLFAHDLIASYPGTNDKNYNDMCKKLTESLMHPESIYHYEAPKIEQIIVDDELAVVRLIWTLKIAYKNKADTEVIQEKGLDVFQRQKDGSWKIRISYAYPLK
jgi:ketosteroid isomerase-like protein